MILTKSSYFFSVYFSETLFVLSSHTDSWKALPFIPYFPFSFLWRLQAKGHVYVTHAENLSSPWRREVLPRGTVIHTTQETPLDQSISASRLPSSTSVCLSGYFLPIIKAQIQSFPPQFPLFYVVCLEKPQRVSVWAFLCDRLYRKMSASGSSSRRKSIPEPPRCSESL